MFIQFLCFKNCDSFIQNKIIPKTAASIVVSRWKLSWRLDCLGANKQDRRTHSCPQVFYVLYVLILWPSPSCKTIDANNENVQCIPFRDIFFGVCPCLVGCSNCKSFSHSNCFSTIHIYTSVYLILYVIYSSTFFLFWLLIISELASVLQIELWESMQALSNY